MTNSEELREKAETFRKIYAEQQWALPPSIDAAHVIRVALYDCAAGICAAIEKANAQ